MGMVAGDKSWAGERESGQRQPLQTKMQVSLAFVLIGCTQKTGQPGVRGVRGSRRTARDGTGKPSRWDPGMGLAPLETQENWVR